jgi:hypothetical protein
MELWFQLIVPLNLYHKISVLINLETKVPVVGELNCRDREQ